MRSNFKIASFRWKRSALKDPRVVMRVVIGVLLAANLVAAVIAFKPFGGSDPREEQIALGRQLADMEKKAAADRQLVSRIETGRREGDRFLAEYVTDARVLSSTIGEELSRAAKEAGIRELPRQTSRPELIEGSASLYMVRIQAGYEGNYASLKKMVELLDKSPRFLIIEKMTVVSPQQQSGQLVNVNIVLDTFMRDASGASS